MTMPYQAICHQWGHLNVKCCLVKILLPSELFINRGKSWLMRHKGGYGYGMGMDGVLVPRTRRVPPRVSLYRGCLFGLVRPQGRAPVSA